ncbi:MAG: retropepsin-like aspartic protease [Cyanobacteria bacterium P01_C01_bin.72]
MIISRLILATVIFNSIAVSVLAQNRNSCYMMDGNGNAINLGHLCQKRNSSSYRRHTPPRNTDILYSDEYVSKKDIQIVPIKSRRLGIPIIDVKFNDKYTFEMMLDTGASGVLITSAMAKKLKVHQSGFVYVSTPSDNYVKMPVGRVYSVGVGELKQKNLSVITSHSMDMGLLGQSFFSNYDMTIKSDVVEFRAR